MSVWKTVITADINHPHDNQKKNIVYNNKMDIFWPCGEDLKVFIYLKAMNVYPIVLKGNRKPFVESQWFKNYKSLSHIYKTNKLRFNE